MKDPAGHRRPRVLLLFVCTWTLLDDTCTYNQRPISVRNSILEIQLLGKRRLLGITVIFAIEEPKTPAKLEDQR